jgi:hypothetical protein
MAITSSMEPESSGPCGAWSALLRHTAGTLSRSSNAAAQGARDHGLMTIRDHGAPAGRADTGDHEA